MDTMPIMQDCTDFFPMGGEFESKAHHRHEQPNCTECVYFSRRNCGRDAVDENYLFDQPFL